MKPDQIAAQLYTVREHCQDSQGLARSARKIREIGYTAVQVSGLGPIPDGEVVRVLSGEGLRICATHESADWILNSSARVIERLQTYGCRFTAYAYPAGVDLGDAAQRSQLIAGLDRSGAELRRAGITLGYHNHALEFVRPGGGERVLDEIFRRTDPGHLVAELDTYWVHCGGGDVVQWIDKLAGRQPFIHLKDYGWSAENKPYFAEIGSGNLDWSRILPAAERAGCEWFIIEQDICPTDPFDCLARSYRYLRERFAS